MTELIIQKIQLIPRFYNRKFSFLIGKPALNMCPLVSLYRSLKLSKEKCSILDINSWSLKEGHFQVVKTFVPTKEEKIVILHIHQFLNTIGILSFWYCSSSTLSHSHTYIYIYCTENETFSCFSSEIRWQKCFRFCINF